MLTTIFAAQPPDPAVPWWWQTWIVPVAVVLLSSLLSFLSGRCHGMRTERYRWSARWEPFGKDMWLRQVALYPEALKAANNAMGAFSVAAGELSVEARERMRRICEESLRKLDAARVEASVLLPEEFNELYGQIVAYIMGLALAADNRSAATPKDRQVVATLTWVKMNACYAKLLNIARKNLHVESLSEKTMEAMTPKPEEHQRLTGFKSIDPGQTP